VVLPFAIRANPSSVNRKMLPDPSGDSSNSSSEHGNGGDGDDNGGDTKNSRRPAN
jgi:hypothetical protein